MQIELTTSPRMRVDMTGIWRFQADPAGQGEGMGFFQADHDFRFWHEVTIPCIFDQCQDSLVSYEGPGWFTREFELPKNLYDQNWVIRFEAANTLAKGWLNGVSLGEHRGGFLPFEWSLDAALQPGRNRLTVCVDNTRRAGDVPGLKRGWRPQGGLLREVHLESRPRITLVDPVIRAEAGGCFEVRFNVANAGTETPLVMPTVVIESDAGQNAFRMEGSALQTRAGKEVAGVITGSFPNAENWSPVKPTIYRMRLQIRPANREILDEVILPMGFRTLSIEGGRLCLNGSPIFLKGFNRHDDSPATGLATDLKTTESDLRHMQAMGANFVRLCHYPHHPAELDLCDRLGLMVMEEIPLYWWDGADAVEVKIQAGIQLQSLIRRDRHHPSVAIWSVSNETEEDHLAVQEGNRELVRQAQALDPTRWAVHVSNCWGDDRGDFDADDVICVNHYPSFNGYLKDPNYSPDCARVEWARDLETLSARYPGKPVVVAEFGYVAWAGTREGLLSEDHQAQVIESEFRGITAVAAVCGSLIWCYADHPWPEEDFLNRVTLSPYGVVTRDRREKRVCATLRTLFHGPATPRPSPGPTDNRPVIMIRPHLRDLPDVPFAAGFGIRPMTLADAGLWEDIERDAEPFFKVESGLFLREFGSDPGAIPRRCFLMTAPNGCAVGTISAWYNRDFRGRDYGRIHWVAVRPAFQGKGLAKAGLAHALKVMAQWHDCVYLVTSSGRTGAIKLYQTFGFQVAID